MEYLFIIAALVLWLLAVKVVMVYLLIKNARLAKENSELKDRFNNQLADMSGKIARLEGQICAHCNAEYEKVA